MSFLCVTVIFTQIQMDILDANTGKTSATWIYRSIICMNRKQRRMSALNEYFPDTDWHQKSWLPFHASKQIELYWKETLPLVSNHWLRLYKFTSYFSCSYSPLLTEPGSTSGPSEPSTDTRKHQHPARPVLSLLVFLSEASLQPLPSSSCSYIPHASQHHCLNITRS